MRRERILLILGIWVAILPYLGFPYSWKNILFTLSGLALIYLSYNIYNEAKSKELNQVPKEEKQISETFDNFYQDENKEHDEFNSTKNF